MPTLPFKQVDVFTRQPFLGNPVAVVIGADRLDTATMQRIAAWTNLSETTFLLPSEASTADYRLRIFTPNMELPFAGHPTLGSAHAAIEAGYVAPKFGKLRQECGAGILDLSVEDGKIFVRAPTARLSQVQVDPVRRALKAKNLSSPLRVDVGAVWIVAEVDSVAALQPDLEAVASVSNELDAAGITVFDRSREGDCVMHVRSFAPAHGIPEDPVCGSGNVSIAAYLRETGKLGDFGSQYSARQGMSIGRDGRLFVRVNGESIEIGGYSVTTVDGKLTL